MNNNPTVDVLTTKASECKSSDLLVNENITEEQVIPVVVKKPTNGVRGIWAPIWMCYPEDIGCRM